MMLHLLGKKLLSSTSCRCKSRLLLRCVSSSTSPIPNPEPHFMVGYLITSCGLTPEKAVIASKRLTHLKSPKGPDSVVAILKQWGFDDTHICRLISVFPNVLGYNVDKPLQSNIKTLLEMGFSRTQLPRLLIRNPRLLVLTNIGPRIHFWRTLLGNDDTKLRTALMKNRGLFCHDPTSSLNPKISLLTNYGLSDQQIQRILLLGGSLFTSSTSSIESLLKWTEDLQLPVSSPTFVYYLVVLNCIYRAGFKAKMELLGKYGWSEQEFHSAFKKFPRFATLTQQNMQAKMEFFVGEAKCMPSYIAHHRILFSFSLEKRLMPRNLILQMLKENEMISVDFCSAMKLTESKFSEKCIHPFQDKMPRLHESYSDACAGSYPILPSGSSK